MLGTHGFVNVQTWLCIWKEEKSETLIRNLLGLLSECLVPAAGYTIIATDQTPTPSLEPGGFLQRTEQTLTPTGL